MAVTKYPKEIFTNIKTKNGGAQTFSVASNLQFDEDKPLAMMSSLSRYVLTAVEKNSSGKTSILIGNIPAKLVPAIAERAKSVLTNTININADSSEKATEKPWPVLERNKKICEALELSPTMGNNKGKPFWSIPAEDIKKYREFLGKNAEKYPKNKEIINKIDLFLTASKEIQDKCVSFMKETRSAKDRSTTAPSGELIIYESGTKPRVSQKREDGKVQVYNIKIAYVIGQNYPFNVTITNYYAFVKKTDTGALNVQGNSVCDKVSSIVRMSELDGLAFVKSMEDDAMAYKISFYARQLKKADELVKSNIEQSKKNAENDSDAYFSDF